MSAFSTRSFSTVFKTLFKAPLVASLVLGFVAATSVSVQPGLAGVTHSNGKASSGGKTNGSTRVVRKSVINSGSSGFASSESSMRGSRIVKRSYSRESLVTNSRTGNSRIYVKRRSLANGEFNRNASSVGKVTVRSGRSSAGFGGVVPSSLSRSGVRYDNRSSVRYVNRKLEGHSHRLSNRVGGLAAVAGHDNRRTKFASGGVVKSYLRGEERRHGQQRYYNGGNIIIVTTPSGSLQEIAGSTSDQNSENCELGTYCTIDLGGPKIITFNDVADIDNGEIAQEELTEEEYQRKYGTK